MRLNNYLIEDGSDDIKNMDQLLEILKGDCSDYLKEIKWGKYGWLYRGTFNDGMNIVPNLILKKSHINDRKPKVAGFITHKLTNEAGKKIFGWPIRNGVATKGSTISSFSDNLSHAFGTMRIFLPIGKYKFVWSPKIEDFNYGARDEFQVHNKIDFKIINELDFAVFSTYDINKIKKIIQDRNLPYSIDDIEKILYPLFYNFVKKSYSNNDLEKAILSKNEVSFNCDEYYLVKNKSFLIKTLRYGGLI